MTDNRINMGEGRVFTVLLRLGAPAMVSMFFTTLYALVDTIFVAKLGTIPLAAMSLAVPLFFIAMSLCKGVAVGALAIMSHARGRGDHKQAEKVAKATYPLAFLSISALLLLALPTFNQPLFALFDNHPQLLSESGSYMRWLALSFPVIGFAMLCEAIFFSYGDTKTPMLAMIAGNLLNIILDPLLIFSCGLGVEGASLASLMGWILSSIIMGRALKNRGLDYPCLFFSRKHLESWPQIITLGAPVAVSMLVIPISFIMLNYLLADFGPAYVGAWNLSTRIEQMVTLPLYGLSCALVPFIAFNLGLKRFDRIKEACKSVLLGCYVIVFPIIILFWFHADTLIHLFKPSPEVLEQAIFALKIIGLGYLFTPFELIMTSLSQGLKKPKYSLSINCLRFLLLRIPLALLFSQFWGGHGIYISLPVSLTISGIVSFLIIRHLLKEWPAKDENLYKEQSTEYILEE
ncbi:MAG: MATE family efflux transporter [Deltaproteobacteria bacterium]|nr:MATE family efflux transporter [Candidatus Tharpella aukensis]